MVHHVSRGVIGGDILVSQTGISLLTLKHSLMGCKKEDRYKKAGLVYSVEDTPVRSAAVFVLFAHLDDSPILLLIRRSQHVALHKGDVAFPGGVREASDLSDLETAYRETEEEIGAHVDQIEFWGELNKVETSTGFTVTPFTGQLLDVSSLTPQRREVAEIIMAPMNALIDPHAVRSISVLNGAEIEHVPAYAYNGHVIWGATARILSQVIYTSCLKTSVKLS